MSQLSQKTLTARCSCGSVELELTGLPLMCVACHCNDCHEGSRRIEALQNAPKILDAYGGTPHALYRKDRIKYLKGAQLVATLRVDDDSPNRAYASCCNSYMLLDLPKPMHWAPVHRNRIQGELPKLEMRINAKFKNAHVEKPTDVPSYSSFPFKFILKLMRSRFAMLLHR